MSPTANKPDNLPGILAGIKVVEFAQNAAVPHCGRLMAGMGADVVKVEPPSGDAMRAGIKLAPNEAKAFAVINPGKPRHRGRSHDRRGARGGRSLVRVG